MAKVEVKSAAPVVELKKATADEKAVLLRMELTETADFLEQLAQKMAADRHAQEYKSLVAGRATQIRKML